MVYLGVREHTARLKPNASLSPPRPCGQFRNEEATIMLAPGHHASADFNGDGYSDVLMRDFRGSTLSLYGDQSGGLTAGLTLNWSPTSTIDGFGDFNGDGREDIL